MTGTWFLICQSCWHIAISCAFHFEILCSVLNVRKIYARWKPHILTDYNRVRVQADNQFQKELPEFDQIPFLYCYCWRNMGSLFRTCKKTWKQKWQIKQGKSHVVAKKPITNRCYTIKKNKQRPESGFRYVFLLHDNPPSHTSELVKQLLKSEKVTVLSRPS